MKLLATENQNTKTRALPPMPGRNYVLALPVFEAKNGKCTAWLGSSPSDPMVCLGNIQDPMVGLIRAVN